MYAPDPDTDKIKLKGKDKYLVLILCQYSILDQTSTGKFVLLTLLSLFYVDFTNTSNGKPLPPLLLINTERSQRNTNSCVFLHILPGFILQNFNECPSFFIFYPDFGLHSWIIFQLFELWGLHIKSCLFGFKLDVLISIHLSCIL